MAQRAPAFDLTGIDGQRYSLSEALARGPVLAAFFKVSCPTCHYTFPFLERLYQQFRSQGMQLWGIVQDTARDGQRFAQERGITFPILVDPEPYATSRQYRLKFVPALFLIEPDGHIAWSGDGFSKADLLEIQQYFARHFATQPPPLFAPDEKVPEYKPG